MTTLLEKISDACILKVVKVTKEVEELFQIIKSDLSKKEKQVYELLKNEKRKKEWLSVRILLKELLGEYKEIKYRSSNNPYIESEFDISITHSKDITGIIISKNKNIGIDTEFISDRILKTAHKFISDKEFQCISNDLKLKKLYLNWCGKETLFKIKGGGGIDFKEDLKIDIGEINELGSLIGFYKHETQRPEKYILYYQFLTLNNSELLITWHS